MTVKDRNNMQIIKPSAVLAFPINPGEIMKNIELAGRTCYKSEDKITPESSGAFVRKLIKMGHESVLEHEKISMRIVCDRGCCYDDQTKVLTDSGWKFFKDVSAEDKFYSLDDDRQLAILAADAITCIPYDGIMDLYSSTQINACVTPNHNMWVYDYEKRPRNRQWKFIESRKVVNGRYKFYKSSVCSVAGLGDEVFSISGCVIPRGFYSQQYPALTLNTSLFLELVGWWITDGSISYGKNGSGARLMISQVKTRGRKRIEYILLNLGLAFTKYKDHFRINSPQLLKWLADNFLEKGNTRKTYYCGIPRWMLKLKPKYLSYFLDGIIGGDGTRHTGGAGFQIYTASEKFANDLVELCLILGKCANIYEVKAKTRTFPNGKISNCRKQYVVSIVCTPEHLFLLNSESKREVWYKGNIYCVSLPRHHRLYVMRSGKSFWCGNSHELVRHRLASFSQESTRYVDYAGDIKTIDISPFVTPDQLEVWRLASVAAEMAYKELRRLGASPQIARSVLPNSLKTEIVVSANLRQWRLVLKQRTASGAHPQMREVMNQVKELFIKLLPDVFGDLENS